jgi:hypothetical protein
MTGLAVISNECIGHSPDPHLLDGVALVFRGWESFHAGLTRLAQAGPLVTSDNFVREYLLCVQLQLGSA